MKNNSLRLRDVPSRKAAGRLISTIAIGLQIALWTNCGSGPPPVTSVTSVSILFTESSASTTGSSSITVSTGATVQLKASVNGTGNPSHAVNWGIDNQVDVSDTTLGAITQGGLYTAPPVVPYPATVIVRATSVFDTTKVGFITLTITSPAEDWPKFRRDFANSGVSGETGISSSNVGQLALKWKFNSGNQILSSPVVATVSGIRTVYIGDSSGTMYAVNADTGEQIWSYTVDQVGPCAIYGLGCTLNSSAAMQDGKLYFGAGNAYVYALDASTGSLVWKTQLGDPNLGYAIYTSPAVYNRLVYVGVASAYDQPCVPGQVLALDAGTGAPVWTFDTLDQSTCPGGNCVGAAVWSSPALDVRFGTVYVGTGNPGETCVPPTADATKYPDGILGLDLATGQLKSYFPAPSSPAVDADMGSAPILHQTSTLDNCAGTDQTLYWLSIASKDSHVYTAPRGATGLLADAQQIVQDPSQFIGSPLALPFTQSQACGQGSRQVVTAGNYIFAPAERGTLIDLQQLGNGRTSNLGTIAPPPCPAGALCLQWSSPVAIQDLVFFGGGDNNLHAATATGSPVGQAVWQFATQGAIISSPAISHGDVYFGSLDGYVYCVSVNGQ
ncbi:MAG TPA: PQQ-binding-like beta-propeller repeat protein [Terriglobia bacterium]|nr:PQQ-binding-like beta-propeller repeat protein [Terriglobia bacterium]